MARASGGMMHVAVSHVPTSQPCHFGTGCDRCRGCEVDDVDCFALRRCLGM